MPRKRRVSPDVRARWLADLEGGKPETQIAREAKSDKRTVKDNLQLAMMERAATTARVDIIKATAVTHQKKLLEALERMRPSPAFSAESSPVTWHCDHGESMRARLVVALRRFEQRKMSLPEEEPLSMLSLLREHLKRTPLTRLLIDHSNRGDDYERALLNLQLKVVDVLEDRTRLRLLMGAPGGPASFMFCHTAGYLAFKYAMEIALAPPDTAIPFPEITVFKDRGEVHSGGQILAVAMGREESVKKALERALKELAASEEVQQVRKARDAVREAAKKVDTQVRELTLLEFVGGECRVCRKLGLWTPGGLRK